MSEATPTASLGESTSWSGRAIGPYRLLSVLGEGGFGQVWLAEQREPVERRVALKIIRPGIDPQRVLARFEAEGQALALMDHPGVAKVLDAGQTPDGLPYFAIEYVRGASITEFADAEGLSVEDRVRLMIQVAEAVHHAHMKGVVHRDLKPSNILVERLDTPAGGRALPKVIDFGIAKALHRPLTDRPLHTEAGQVLGTPEYMSPEQARGDADVDTRADVYSLGAILYELLTGATPLDADSARRAGMGEVLRQIAEVDPVRPSTRVATGQTRAVRAGGSGTGVPPPAPTRDGVASAPARRPHGPRVDPDTLSRRLRGELDWIAMRCLEKDRARRYDSAGALARDLQRFLDDEPVEAGPPSTSYRLSKFVHRNRALVATVAASFALLALAAAVAIAAWGQAVVARDEAMRATRTAQEALERAEDDRAIAVRERTRAEAEAGDAVAARDEAEAVTSFLARMIESVEPDEQGRDVTVAEVLDQAAASVGDAMEGRPLVEARLRQTLGNSYRGLGMYDQAEEQLPSALAILERELGPSNPRTLRAMMNVAGFRQEQGRHEEAAAIGERVVALAKDGGEEARRILLGAMNNLALAYSDLGRLSEAGEMMRRTVELMNQVFGAEHEYTLGATSNAGLMLAAAHDYEAADRMFRTALEGWERAHGVEHPGTLLAKGNLAGNEIDLGRPEEGLRLYREVYETRVRTLGEAHPDTIRSRINIGHALEALGRAEEAIAENLIAWDQAVAALGPVHPDTLTVAGNLADLYADHGWPPETDGSVRSRLEALLTSLRAIADEPSATAAQLNSAAWILLTIEPGSRRDPAAALRAAERACALEREAGAPGEPGASLWEYLDTLGMARAGVGDVAGAIEAQRESISLIPPHGEGYRAELEGRLREYEAAR